MPNLFSYSGLQQFSQGQWRFWLARERGAFLSQTAPGVYTSQPLADPMGLTGDLLKFQPYTTNEAAPSDGVYTKTRRTILLPAQVVTGGVIPKPGDQITRASDGTLWTVLSVAPGKYQTTYRLESIDLGLAFGLLNLGNLWRAAGAPNANGMRVPGLTVFSANIPCKVQRIQGSRGGDEVDSPTLKVDAIAYLGQQVIPLYGDMFDDGAGNKYTVVAWRDADKLDALAELDLVDMP